MPLPASAAEPSPVRIWDLPTRVFHWVLAVAIVGSVVTAKVGGNAMAWHMRLGYLVLALLLFRLLWGLVGGHWSRFASFAYGPGAVLRYLRDRSRPDEHHDVGHNPLGSFSVFALLGFLLLQVATGLVANDEILTQGPLYRFVSGATSSAATYWHKDFGQWIIIALVALHVGAILWYLSRGTNLVAPMVAGDKRLPAGTPAARDGTRERLLALVLALLSAGAVTWLVRLGG